MAKGEATVERGSPAAQLAKGAGEFRARGQELLEEISRRAPRIERQWARLERIDPELARDIVRQKLHALGSACEVSSSLKAREVVSDRAEYGIEHVALGKALIERGEDLEWQVEDARWGERQREKTGEREIPRGEELERS